MQRLFDSWNQKDYECFGMILLATSRSCENYGATFLLLPTLGRGPELFRPGSKFSSGSDDERQEILNSGTVVNTLVTPDPESNPNYHKQPCGRADGVS